VHEINERNWADLEPSQILFSPPARDIYRLDYTPQDNGVRCVKCGSVVHNAPGILASAPWRCSACAGRAGWVVMPMKDEYKGYDWSGGTK